LPAKIRQRLDIVGGVHTPCIALLNGREECRQEWRHSRLESPLHGLR
jgi:hypothetical protein